MAKRKFRRKRNPSFQMTGGSVLSVALLAALGVVGFMVYKNRAVIAEKLKTAFNPASTGNLAYQGASSIVQAATGDKTASLGTKIADWFKSDAEKAVDALKYGTPTITDAMMAQGSYYDLGQKIVPIGAAAAINKSGTMTDSAYRDQLRGNPPVQPTGAEYGEFDAADS